MNSSTFSLLLFSNDALPLIALVISAFKLLCNGLLSFCFDVFIFFFYVHSFVPLLSRSIVRVVALFQQKSANHFDYRIYICLYIFACEKKRRKMTDYNVRSTKEYTVSEITRITNVIVWKGKRNSKKEKKVLINQMKFVVISRAMYVW